MYLKKIKIYGFKSFADEIGFEFDPGLTAIVGPNGCGKSNILDAFNWVLGEQSSYRLRGSEMQDMIFKGSKTRKPLGFASVELCMDNSKDILPIDYDEITVERRIYRSGESEYYINKGPCRLKDVKELFADTGIGTRSYSIMEQNNVRFILESSPLDRRSLIEEAAGIRRYKDKKLEAERRLERIRDDLREVKNIMAEVQKNIRRLRRQSHRAKRYNEVNQRLSRLEISRLCQDYTRIQEELGGGAKNVSGLQDRITELTSVRNGFASEILQKETEKENFDSKLLDMNRNIYRIESETEIIKNRIENFDSSQERLDEEIKRHFSSIEYNEERITQLEAQMEELRAAEDTETEKQLEDLAGKCRALAESEEKLDREVLALRNSLEEKEKLVFELKNREIDLRNKSQGSDRRLEELNARKRELEEKISDMKKEMASKTDALNSLEKEFVKDSQEMDSLIEQRDASDIEIQSRESKKESVLTQYHRTKSEFDSGKKYLPQLTSIEEIVKNGINGIEGPIQAILEDKMEEQHIRKLSNIIGERVGWMIASDRNSALSAINFLRERNLPSLTFILKDSIPQVDAVYELPGSITDEIKVILNYLAKSLNIEERDGVLWHSECILTGGGESPLRSRKYLVMETDIKQLEQDLKNAEKEIEKLKAQRDDSQNRIIRLSNKRRLMLAEISPLRHSLGQMTGSHEYVNNELNAVNREISSLSDIRVIDADAERAKKELEDTRRSLEENRETLRKKQDELSSAAMESVRMNTKKKSLEDILDRRKESIETVSSQKEQLAGHNIKLKDIIADLESKQEYQVKQNGEDKKKISELKEEKASMLALISDNENMKGSLVKEINGLKEDQKKREEELETLKNEMGEQRQTEERLKERMENIKVRLKEDMGVSLAGALEDYQKEPVSEEEISALRETLERIGHVNLEAPEEYEKEFQRFEFIKKHVDDLEQADNDIKTIIRKINQQTKDKFLETFNSVNENFGKIFVKLFEGGEARLLLTDPENILESGIDIIARPSGKNLTSLKLISGGESALCAIALMFAIYEVKPTPFCILDEVDSPLDDTNLHRFLMMLKDYTRSTQFIIITHNKLTMQMCDTFYGITMEEFGVSKIISVKLRGKKAS